MMDDGDFIIKYYNLFIDFTNIYTLLAHYNRVNKTAQRVAVVCHLYIQDYINFVFYTKFAQMFM